MTACDLYIGLDVHKDTIAMAVAERKRDARTAQAAVVQFETARDALD
ncbi:hypothetical protein [Bradyrhizobium genosp. A]